MRRLQIEPVKLTKREEEIIRLSGQGLFDSEIAARLGLAPSTIRNHIRAICHKLGATHRLMCGALAERAGFLTDEDEGSGA